MAPPCASFGHWSRFSKDMRPDTWSRSREIGECFSTFAAQLCNAQMHAGRHFFGEDPVGFELFLLVSSQAIWDPGRVVIVFQCAFGLGGGGGADM